MRIFYPSEGAKVDKKTILAVEDDLEICILYKFLLEKEGYTFKSKSDTEVILALYDKFGKKCLQ